MKREDRGRITDEVLLQPWFLPKKIAFSIRRLMPMWYADRMVAYFSTYGCLRCNRRKVVYACCGLCENCKNLIRSRLARCLKREVKNEPLRVELDTPRCDPQRTKKAQRLLADLVPKQPKAQGANRMKKSQFAYPNRGSYSPSIKR